MYHNIDPSAQIATLALRLALGLGIAFVGLVGQANAEQTIYKWVDANGATHYSYRAPQNAKKTSKVRTYNDYSTPSTMPSTPAAANNPEPPVTTQPPLSNQPAKPQQSPAQPTAPEQKPQQTPSNNPTAEKTQPSSSGLSRI